MFFFFIVDLWMKLTCLSYSGGGRMIFNFFDCSNPFCFLLIEFHYTFFPVLIKYYHIMFIIIVFKLGSDKLFSCIFAVFLLFSAMGSVTVCDSSLGSSCYSGMILHFAFMHLLSIYYYYGYVIIGVLRPSRVNWYSLLNRFCCVLWG